MKTIIIDKDITILKTDEGKILTSNYIEDCNEVSLGYVYYDKEGNKLEEPHFLTAEDFIEVDKEDEESISD